MLDSKPGPIDPTQMNEMEPVERALPFRFKVTWASVFDPLEAVMAPGEGLSRNERARGMVVAPARPSPVVKEILCEKPAREPVLAVADPFGSGSGVRWEMVVPKMVRVSPKAVTHEPSPRNPNGTSDLPRRTPAEGGQTVPNFYTASGGLSWLRPRSLRLKLLLAAMAAIGIAVNVWMQFAFTPTAITKIETTKAVGGWVREPVTRAEAGFDRYRRLVLYRPSLKASDCRFEFDWKPNTEGIGWVFRANDTSNYYAMRIKLLKEGSAPMFSLKHLAVYRGVENARDEKMLVLSKNDPVLRIRTELAGSAFTVFLGGTAVEYWTDKRFLSGALGFLEEGTENVDVKSVRMSFDPGTQIQGSLLLNMNRFMKAAGREGV